MHIFRIYANPTDDRAALHGAVLAALAPLLRGRAVRLVDALPFGFAISPHASYLGGDGEKWFRSDYADRLERAATDALIATIGAAAPSKEKQQ